MERESKTANIKGMKRVNASSACKECRARKIKCISMGDGPCASCAKLQCECISRSDGRKDRYRSQKIDRLEQTVADYQQLLEKISQNHQSTTELLKKLGRPRHSSSPRAPNPSLPLDEPVFLRTERTYFSQIGFSKDSNTYLPIFGPTSVMDADELAPRQHEAEIRQLREKPDIIECVRLFFRWQYPDMHSFVFREAFLLDFFDPNSPGVYSSTELVYAICCVGATMADDAAHRNLAGKFYRIAREMLMASLDFPSIGLLQAYMLLGLYDIYNGNINTGWMLTGDAIRMGYGMGFHVSPECRLHKDEPQNQNDDISSSVRSRIFWGTFAADRFIGLILGRPSVIKVNETTIPIAANMPALEWIEPYTYPGAPEDDKTPYIDISNPLLNITKLAKISDEMMENVFTTSTSRSGGTACDPGIEEKLKLVRMYNEHLLRWRDELPANMKWDRQMLKERGHNNHVMFLRYFYYMVLLCLNRPFAHVMNRLGKLEALPNSLEICMEIIEDLHCCIHSFIKLNGATRCSVLIVYLCIISLSVLLMISKGNYLGVYGKWCYEFMLVLKHATHWRLSSVSYNKLKVKFEQNLEVPFELALRTYAELVGTEETSIFWALKSHEKKHLLKHESHGPAYTVPELKTRGDNFNSFGGPPVFMTSEVNDWINLFPEILEER